MNRIGRRIYYFFSSRLFLGIILGFFIFEALWFVFSAVYPMAFDEDFHFGLIKLYSHYWLPFFSHQPPGADQFGAVFRDPSYLYHYLMSFPYRFIALFVHSETMQVITLRLLNVTMFTGALLLYRKMLLGLKASKALVHVTLAIFILIPIVPQLAAHINYDNLFILLLPLLCMSAFALLRDFKKQQVNALALLVFVILAMVLALVKYPGLPIILAAVLFLAAYVTLAFEGRFGRLVRRAVLGFKMANRRVMALLVVALIVVLGLFAQRYGVNLVRYHNPVPDCGKVMTVKQCSAYSPWYRDYVYKQSKSEAFHASPLRYMWLWLWGMWHRLFFAVNGPSSNFTNYDQLPAPGLAAILLAASLGTVVVWWRRIFRSDATAAFCMTVAVGYIAVLWLNGYADYSRVGEPIAINGRYLLPVLPLMAVPLGRGIKYTLQRFKVEWSKPFLALVALLLLLHGGGVFTFILRSDDSWYWPNKTVQKVNNTARKVLAPVTTGAKFR